MPAVVRIPYSGSPFCCERSFRFAFKGAAFFILVSRSKKNAIGDRTDELQVKVPEQRFVLFRIIEDIQDRRPVYDQLIKRIGDGI